MSDRSDPHGQAALLGFVPHPQPGNGRDSSVLIGSHGTTPLHLHPQTCHTARPFFPKTAQAQMGP